jgi:hypothetical protein
MRKRRGKTTMKPCLGRFRGVSAESDHWQFVRTTSPAEHTNRRRYEGRGFLKGLLDASEGFRNGLADRYR